MNRKKEIPNKTTDDHEKIRRELYELFSFGYSIPFIAQKTGHDISLVKTHFTEWSETMEDEIDLQGQKKNALVNLIIQLDKIIESFEGQVTIIKSELEKRKNKFNLELMDLLTKIYGEIAKLHANKAYFLLHAPDEIRLGEIK